jgi:DNA-binding FrmR family transcriptional regulator
MAKCCDKENPSHEKQIPRLNRVIGQIEGIKKMIAERRYCPEIIQQFKAVKSAVKAVEREVFNTHLNSCVAASFKNEGDRDRKIAEIKRLIEGL